MTSPSGYADIEWTVTNTQLDRLAAELAVLEAERTLRQTALRQAMKANTIPWSTDPLDYYKPEAGGSDAHMREHGQEEANWDTMRPRRNWLSRFVTGLLRGKRIRRLTV